MGTPHFAVASLKALLDHGYDVCGVVTAPDRPAGRGQKLKMSPVKEYAVANGLDVMQAEKLKDPGFIQKLQSYNADLFIVVAFRMLPREVWEMPGKGTFNLHASLLPQYRGAAPINHTIINGETKGGVTTFFLKHEIDTGAIIFREETDIGDDETAGEYHDRLMTIGADLVLKTVDAIQNGNVHTHSQDDYLEEGELLKKAPKIFKDDCRIDWHKSAEEVYNLIRGLSPYPAAFTLLSFPSGKEVYLKVYRAQIKYCDCQSAPGTPMTDYKDYLNICCKDACISLLEVQQSGKKRLKIKEFLAGLKP